MLVLTRQENEVIYIGPNIKIILLKSRCGSVKLGIEAPKEFIISRDMPPAPTPAEQEVK